MSKNTKQKLFYTEIETYYIRFPFVFSECLGFPTIQHGRNLISLSEELFMDTDGKYHQYSNYPTILIQQGTCHLIRIFGSQLTRPVLSNFSKELNIKELFDFFLTVKVETNRRLRKMRVKLRGF